MGEGSGVLSLAVMAIFVVLLAVLLRRERDALRHSLTALERERGQLASLTRMREQLLHSVAHELRGPLAVLDNALDIFESDYAELDQAEMSILLRSTRRTARRLRVLMEDLLSAGAIQAGRFTIQPEAVPIETILHEAVEAVEMTLRERGQRIDLDLGASPDLEVRADTRYTRQVMANLLTNASKYGPRDAPIRVSAERREGEIRVEVEDRGPGIAEEQQGGLFERYYRVGPGTVEPGIGLGLAIAKGIVEAHGGRIGVDSHVGRGTTVWFTLPAAQSVSRSLAPA